VLLLKLLRRNSLNPNLKERCISFYWLPLNKKVLWIIIQTSLKLLIMFTDLCGLSLLLKLLELLRRHKTDWFVSCDELGAGRHRGQDDVPAQAADAAQRTTKQAISTT